MLQAHGGVFVNYRYDDEPVAAATVHAWLALQFGADRVFRDCDTMRPGDHYPSAIRDALNRASVLVAIVGPHWLTLTEPTTGVRLIDRDHDWVRLEIADALRRGIHIVPVLLQDTPASARPPAPADLPSDISRFATLQAFMLSQRRLTEDLVHLAEHLVRLDPTLLGPVPHDDATSANRSRSPFAELVEAFLAVPCVRDEHCRRSMLSLIDPAIATAVPYHADDRAHVISLVQTSLQYDGGLAELVEAVRTLSGNGPIVNRLAASIGKFLSTQRDQI